ncbi:hypothetical protein [Humidisolicoccus flavus]|uniref:hypothetical protein n=1 Tax=Humidisolicoccus flavus TaxID=3111414 RepID=UPI003253E185
MSDPQNPRHDPLSDESASGVPRTNTPDTPAHHADPTRDSRDAAAEAETAERASLSLATGEFTAIASPGEYAARTESELYSHHADDAAHAPATEQDAPSHRSSTAEAPPLADAADPAARPVRSQRRTALVAGAIALPLINIGLVTLVLPLLYWYGTTVLSTVIVAVANLVGGIRAANSAEAAIQNASSVSISGVTLGLVIAGAVLIIAGLLVSVLVLRKKVARPGMVTLIAVSMGIVFSSIVIGVVVGLGGALFGSATTTVSQAITNGLLGVIGVGLVGLVVSIIVGGIIWVVSTVLLAPHAAVTPKSGAAARSSR